MNCTRGTQALVLHTYYQQDSKKGKKKKILGYSPDYKILKSLAVKFILQMAKHSALKANI